MASESDGPVDRQAALKAIVDTVAMDRRSRVTMLSTNVSLPDLKNVLRWLTNPPTKLDWMSSLMSMTSSLILVAKAVNDMAGKYSPLNLVLLGLGTLLFGAQLANVVLKIRGKNVHYEAAIEAVREQITLHEQQAVQPAQNLYDQAFAAIDSVAKPPVP